MAPRVFFIILLVNLLLISSCSSEADGDGDGDGDGFISFDISQKGLEFAKDLLINSAISSLIPFQLPLIDTTVKIPIVGSVYVALSDINLYQVNVSSSIVQPGETGITIVASGATANLSLNWSYSYSTWLLDISDSGSASVQVEGMDIGLTLGLKNQQGTLRLSTEDCGCYVSFISIKMDGGASWLYQEVVDFFEDKIASTVEDTITSKILEGVTKLDSLLQSLPKEITFQDVATLNTTITEGPILSNTSLLVGVDGLFTGVDKEVASRHYGNHLQATGSCNIPEKMVGISIHENVLNSASSVYFNAKHMYWVIDKVPEQQLFLNTAGWRFIIPKLYKEFPNDDMSLNFTVSSPPVIKVENQDIFATVYSDVIINVLDAGQVIPVACISVEIEASGFAQISWGTLAGDVNLSKLTMSLKWSEIGNLHMFLVESVMSVLLKRIILPVVNLRLRIGYSLPHFHGYELYNATIVCGDSRIVVCSDIAPEYQFINQRLVS